MICFLCINIRQAEVSTPPKGPGANVNALKKHLRSLLFIKTENICYISRYFLHYFVSPFHRCVANAVFTDYARPKAGQYTSCDGSNSYSGPGTSILNVA